MSALFSRLARGRRKPSSALARIPWAQRAVLVACLAAGASSAWALHSALQPRVDLLDLLAPRPAAPVVVGTRATAQPEQAATPEDTASPPELSAAEAPARGTVPAAPGAEPVLQPVAEPAAAPAAAPIAEADAAQPLPDTNTETAAAQPAPAPQQAQAVYQIQAPQTLPLAQPMGRDLRAAQGPPDGQGWQELPTLEQPAFAGTGALGLQPPPPLPHVGSAPLPVRPEAPAQDTPPMPAVEDEGPLPLDPAPPLEPVPPSPPALLPLVPGLGAPPAPPEPGAQEEAPRFAERPGGSVLVMEVWVNDRGEVVDARIAVPSAFPLDDFGHLLLERRARWSALVPPLLPGEVRRIERRIDYGQRRAPAAADHLLP